jgi:hypothetical protein
MDFVLCPPPLSCPRPLTLSVAPQLVTCPMSYEKERVTFATSHNDDSEFTTQGCYS